ncbi:hypothetical protein BDV59DRAFT_85160 [Aspergillus ambiguus]|uniref:uncharacterized protein n=1 Tax=Aspergillus ambiguus TaxID=176160 RepID=UPI003CCD8D71
MSSEPTANSVATSAVPETSRVDGSKQSTDDTAKQANGDSGRSKPADEKSAPEKKPTEVSKPVEDLKPTDQSSVPTAASEKTDVPSANDKKDESNSGEKRDLEASTVPADPEKPGVSEPAAKKQKVHAETTEAGSKNGVDSANGEKRKAGRPKKGKDAVKKDIPTDGIGSRTRSRTKAN